MAVLSKIANTTSSYSAVTLKELCTQVGVDKWETVKQECEFIGLVEIALKKAEERIAEHRTLGVPDTGDHDVGAEHKTVKAVWDFIHDKELFTKERKRAAYKERPLASLWLVQSKLHRWAIAIFHVITALQTDVLPIMEGAQVITLERIRAAAALLLQFRKIREEQLNKPSRVKAEDFVPEFPDSIIPEKGKAGRAARITQQQELVSKILERLRADGKSKISEIDFESITSPTKPYLPSDPESVDELLKREKEVRRKTTNEFEDGNAAMESFLYQEYTLKQMNDSSLYAHTYYIKACQALKLDLERPTVKGMNIYLSPHQVIGLYWLWLIESAEDPDTVPGGIVGDFCGSGKTIICIAFLVHCANQEDPQNGDTIEGIDNPDDKEMVQEEEHPPNISSSNEDQNKPHHRPTLIIVPSQIAHQFTKDIRKYAPQALKVTTYFSPYTDKGKIKQIQRSDFKPSDQNSEARFPSDKASTCREVIMSTYTRWNSAHPSPFKWDSLKRVFVPAGRGRAGNGRHYRDKLSNDQKYFARLIADEGHTIKGGAKLRRALAVIQQKARRYYAFTATPFPNSLGDILGLMEFIQKRGQDIGDTDWDDLTTAQKCTADALQKFVLDPLVKPTKKLKPEEKEVLKQQWAVAIERAREILRKCLLRRSTSDTIPEAAELHVDWKDGKNPKGIIGHDIAEARTVTLTVEHDPHTFKSVQRHHTELFPDLQQQDGGDGTGHQNSNIRRNLAVTSDFHDLRTINIGVALENRFPSPMMAQDEAVKRAEASARVPRTENPWEGISVPKFRRLQDGNWGFEEDDEADVYDKIDQEAAQVSAELEAADEANALESTNSRRRKREEDSESSSQAEESDPQSPPRKKAKVNLRKGKGKATPKKSRLTPKKEKPAKKRKVPHPWYHEKRQKLQLKMFMELGTADLQYWRSTFEPTFNNLFEMLLPDGEEKPQTLLDSALWCHKSCPKLQALLQILKYHILDQPKPERIIIDVENLQTGMALEVYLKELGFRVLVLHAGKDHRERTDLQDLWNKEDGPEIVLMSGKLSGAGFNMHKKCHILVEFDRLTNLYMCERLRGRICRKGQKHICIIYRLITLGTFDHSLELKNVAKWREQIEILRSHEGARDWSYMQLQSAYNGFVEGYQCTEEMFQSAMQWLPKSISEELVELGAKKQVSYPFLAGSSSPAFPKVERETTSEFVEQEREMIEEMIYGNEE